MRAYLNEGYLHLHIDEKADLKELGDKPLETVLQKQFDVFYSEKKIILRYDKNARMPSIEFIPKECSFDKLKGINIVMIKEQYEKLRIRRACNLKSYEGYSVD